jgi:integrase
MQHVSTQQENPPSTPKPRSEFRTEIDPKLFAGYAAIDAFELAMRKTGLKESTIRSRIKSLKTIAKQTNILNPDAVITLFTQKKWEQNTKRKRCEDLDALYLFKNIHWKKPKFKKIGKLPLVPLESHIDQLIQNIQKTTRSSSKYASFLQLLKETGVRPGEAWMLRWSDVDFEKPCVNITCPEKGSNPRQPKISGKLIGMFNTLPRKTSYIFHTPGRDPEKSLDDFRRTFTEHRQKIAQELSNPKILQITFRSLRHYKGTMEYHRTKDILHVMRILGHKNIQNTLVYTHLIQFESDDYVCKVASTVDEAKPLVEQGFEFVTDVDGLKLFRKRK